MRNSGLSLLFQIVAAAGIGFVGVTFATQPQTAMAVAQSVTSTVAQISECNIKGNISVNTGERIYHVPGQRYYKQTRIDQLKGERWFCSESEALAAGWRRSRQ